MFIIMFALGLLGLVTGGIRFFICWIAESVKSDRFSNHRRTVWRNVWIHFGATFLLFYLSFHI